MQVTGHTCEGFFFLLCHLGWEDPHLNESYLLAAVQMKGHGKLKYSLCLFTFILSGKLIYLWFCHPSIKAEQGYFRIPVWLEDHWFSSNLPGLKGHIMAAKALSLVDWTVIECSESLVWDSHCWTTQNL